MRTAFAFKDDFDEVRVSSTEVLEANIAAVRESLNDFKTEVREDFADVRGEIKSLREDLTAEIESVREDLTGEIKSVRDEMRSLREKSDRAFERLFTRFDAEIKETNRALTELGKTVLRIDSRQSAVLWVGGGLGAFITLAVSVGKAFKWF